MANGTKSDNHRPGIKLDLRRHFLRKYHSDGAPIRVMDCCQGSGVMWGTLRKEFPVASYVGFDVKPKPGRIKIESQRVLAQKGWRENVIDIDAYGSPWEHWFALLPNASGPLTVFLTIGRGGAPLVKLSHAELLAMGMTMPSLFKLSGAIVHNLAPLSMSHCIARAWDHGLRILEATETLSDGNARYVGIRLSPQ